MAYAPAILENKCALCIIDTYQEDANSNPSCQACYPSSGTEGKEGATICVDSEDHLVPDGLLLSAIVSWR